MAQILVVEDEPAIQRLIHRVLSRQGHEVALASDGEEGVRQCRSARVDLLIVDALLPRQSGLAVARSLWELRPDVPVLFISGMGAHELQQQGIDLEATLLKPFTPEALMQRVDKLLRRGTST